VAVRCAGVLDRSGGWRDTALVLPPGRWTDVLRADGTGHPVAEGANSLDELVGARPGALLVRA
jgi:(1->4)-alpha-D-glucan 1-alpha-D-glucosylmutase